MQEVNMKSGGYLSVIGYFAIQVAIFEIIVLFITGLICWLIGHWTPAGYSTGLFWAGGLVIVFGIFSIIGGPQNVASGNIRQGFGLPFQRISEPGQGNQLLQNLADGQSSAIVMILAGITTLVIGAIIKSFIA
jgi:hypothetical protein